MDDNTYQVLVGAVPAQCDLDIVPANEQEKEEGQHEKLPVPHGQHKHLKDSTGHEHKRGKAPYRHSVAQPRTTRHVPPTS